MQNTLEDNDIEANINKPVYTKPNQDNIEYSTEHSEVHKHSEEFHEPYHDDYDEFYTPNQVADVFTPDITKNRGIGVKKDKLSKTNVRDYQNKGNIFDTDQNKFINKNQFDKFNEQYDKRVITMPNETLIDSMAEDFQFAKEVIGEKMQKTKETFDTKYKEVQKDVQEGLATAKEKLSTNISHLASNVKEGFEDLKEKATEMLGLAQNPENQFANLEDTYLKLEEIKISENIPDTEKVEKAICEMETIPLDPSHLHDALINNPGLSDFHNPLSVEVPESLKAENPNYLRAEAIKEIITTVGIEIPHDKYLKNKEAQICIDKAIDELDNLSKDPIIKREEATDTITTAQRYSDEDKFNNPDYKRAEAIKDIIGEKAPHYAEYMHTEAVRRNKEYERKHNDSTWENVKEKVSEAISTVKGNAEKLWESTKGTLIEVEHKAEEGISNIEKTVGKVISPDNKKLSDTANATLVTVNKDLAEIEKIERDEELTKPLLADERETVDAYNKMNEKNNSHVLLSNLEVCKKNSCGLDEERLKPKTSPITDIDLSAQVGIPEYSKTHKYDHSGVEKR